MKRLAGLIAAPHTPFHEEGGLNLPVVADQSRLFKEAGISAVFVCGATGEGQSLTVQERKEVAIEWARSSDDDLPVIVHVGHNSQENAVDLAAHAEEMGAYAIAAAAPTFLKPNSADDLIDFLKPVAEAAPGRPFYYYHIPALTGLDIPVDEFLLRGKQEIPTLAGLKYTDTDLMTFQSCVQMKGGEFELLFGLDELLLAGLALGACAAIGSTYNYAVPVYKRVIRAFEEGNLGAARMEQFKMVRLVEVLMEFGVLRAGKAIMSLIGVDCGPTRPPIRPMAGVEMETLYSRIRQMDIFSRPLLSPQEAGW